MSCLTKSRSLNTYSWNIIIGPEAPAWRTSANPTVPMVDCTCLGQSKVDVGHFLPMQLQRQETRRYAGRSRVQEAWPRCLRPADLLSYSVFTLEQGGQPFCCVPWGFLRQRLLWLWPARHPGVPASALPWALSALGTPSPGLQGNHTWHQPIDARVMQHVLCGSRPLVRVIVSA